VGDLSGGEDVFTSFTRALDRGFLAILFVKVVPDDQFLKVSRNTQGVKEYNGKLIGLGKSCL
jgi:hypothetical protein